MLFSRGLRCSTLLILCLSSILLFSQTTPAPEQPATQSGAQVATGGSAQATPAWRPKPWYNSPGYRFIFQYMCIEDQLIQKHTTENGRPVSRTDYTSAIGVSESDAQVMLNIIIDGCRRTDENDKRLKESNDITSNYGKYAQTENDIFNQTWAQVQQSLTPPEFENLDAYIKKDFALPRYPDQRDSTPEHIGWRYLEFISNVDDLNARDQRLIASGQKPQGWNYSREAHFPEEKEQAVLAILVDADRQLKENDRKINKGLAAWEQSTPCANKHPLDLNCPVPPELRALDLNRESIMLETVSRLRLELGEESFNNLDKWISQRWLGGH